ncbi:MAG: glycosyltransferase family 39 protein [Oligoflexia bacterium]|nr:glycosyltransferase family 39 protein [Oligoflexia bacterium]
MVVSKLKKYFSDITNTEIFFIMFLSFVIIFKNIDSIILFGVDSPVYAFMGRELSLRPIWTWAFHTINGTAFIDNPPMLIWINAISISLFGTGTLPIVVPTLLMSWFTIFLTYKIGKLFIDYKYGALAALTLLFTHTFINSSRNPMIEPALMLFTMSSIYFLLCSIKEQGRTIYSMLGGFFWAIAWLSKGPSTLVVPTSLIIFYILTKKIDACKNWRIPLSSFVKICFISLLTFLLIIFMYEAWYYTLTGKIFFLEYFNRQLFYSFVQGRGVQEWKYLYYLHVIWEEYWPWLPVFIITPFFVFGRKLTKYYPTVLLNLTVVIIYILGLSLSKHKGPWYTYPYHVGLSLVSAVLITNYISDVFFKRFFKKACFFVTLIFMLVSTILPSVFTAHERPFIQFVTAAGKQLKYNYGNMNIADCSNVVQWREYFLIKYYLGATVVKCDNYNQAGLKITNFKDPTPKSDDEVIFYKDPYYIIKKQTVTPATPI